MKMALSLLFHNSYLELGIKSLLHNKKTRNKLNKLFLHNKTQSGLIVLTDFFYHEIAHEYRGKNVRIILFGNQTEANIASLSDARVISWYQILPEFSRDHVDLTAGVSGYTTLTLYENQVLSRLAEGDIPKTIAQDLNVTVRIISALKISGMNKLGLSRPVDLHVWSKFNRAHTSFVNSR